MDDKEWKNERPSMLASRMREPMLHEIGNRNDVAKAALERRRQWRDRVRGNIMRNAGIPEVKIVKATNSQEEVLRKYGLFADGMGIEEARDMIGYLKSCGWCPSEAQMAKLKEAKRRVQMAMIMAIRREKTKEKMRRERALPKPAPEECPECLHDGCTIEGCLLLERTDAT